MRIIISLCMVFFLLTLNACETSHSPAPQIDMSGIWRGQIDSMAMVMRLSMTGSRLSGEVVWQVGDPAYGADVGTGSHVVGDSLFIFLTNFNPPQNTASLSGRIVGDTMSGTYYRLHQSVPLSDSGVWEVTLENE